MSEQPAKSDAPPESPKAPRLLVVDDNDDNRNLLSRRLKSKGYQVDLAADGPSALEACAKVAYDAILLDVMMPGMSGIEVLEELRAKHAKTELAVIMATAKNDSVSVVDALKRGANDYVTKPIDFPVLLARLETHLAMKQEAAARGAQVDVTFGIAQGTVLCNRYEILDKIGEGGFAVVYRARQLSTNREVALKHLRPDVLGAPGTDVQLERFERESQLIGELNHPNVVRLIDSGRVSVRPGAPSTKPEGPRAAARESAAVESAAKNDAPVEANSQTRRRSPDSEVLAVPFIVMDLLTGESLSELIEREAPLAATRAVDLMVPILSALSAAHAKGVIHRDIKPSNIMVTSDGAGDLAPKILDFGIAKLTAREKQDLTVSASLLGTPQYMPPEQARGLKDLDGRTDQFAAAAVLYHMLTGHMLYSGESLLDIIIKVLAGSFPSLQNERPDLPPGLAAVIERALATEREDRYPSMTDFGRELLRYASDRTSRRWSDHFEVAAPETADAVESVMAVSIVRSEPGENVALHPTLESPGLSPGRVASFVPKPKVEPNANAPTMQLDRGAIVSTLESEAPLEAAEKIASSKAPIEVKLPSVPEPPKSELPQKGAAKDEAPKSDAPKSEPPKSEGAKSADARSEAPKRESTKSDAPKSERPKSEAPAAAKAESGARASKAPAPAGGLVLLGVRMPWERFALIVIAAFALCYVLSRYVF